MSDAKTAMLVVLAIVAVAFGPLAYWAVEDYCDWSWAVVKAKRERARKLADKIAFYVGIGFSLRDARRKADVLLTAEATATDKEMGTL